MSKNPRGSADDHITIRVGDKLFGEILQFLISINMNSKEFLKDGVESIRANKADLQKISQMEDGDEKGSTYFRCEMTCDYFSFLSHIQEEGERLAREIARNSLKKHNYQKKLQDVQDMVAGENDR